VNTVYNSIFRVINLGGFFMGIMLPYFPTEMAVKLAKIAKADTFVETGTHTGVTAKWASAYFKNVHTIELSVSFFNQFKDDLLSKGNIIPYLGDSRDVLPKIFEKTEGNILFWLDAHYSGVLPIGVTAGECDPCPLLKELEIILKRNNEDIILIDDARCLMGDIGWPSIVELYKKIETSSGENKFLIICDDNIYIIPDKDKYKEPLLQYSLEKNVILWKQDNEIRNPKKYNKREIIIKILQKAKLYNLARSIYKKFKPAASHL
jgi:hypothetical protein